MNHLFNQVISNQIDDRDDLFDFGKENGSISNNFDIFITDDAQIEELQEITLSAEDIYTILFSVFRKHPEYITTYQLDENLINILNATIEEEQGIELNLLDIINTNQSIKEWLYCVFNNILFIPSSKQKFSQTEVIYFIPRSKLNNFNTITLGGRLLYKNKPVITTYNKNLIDKIYRELYGYDGQQNLVDYEMEDDIVLSIDDDIIVFDLINLSNLELANMLEEGQISINDLNELPQNRKRDIVKLMDLLS